MMTMMMRNNYDDKMTTIISMTRMISIIVIIHDPIDLCMTLLKRNNNIYDYIV